MAEISAAGGGAKTGFVERGETMGESVVLHAYSFPITVLHLVFERAG